MDGGTNLYPQIKEDETASTHQTGSPAEPIASAEPTAPLLCEEGETDASTEFIRTQFVSPKKRLEFYESNKENLLSSYPTSKYYHEPIIMQAPSPTIIIQQSPPDNYRMHGKCRNCEDGADEPMRNTERSPKMRRYGKIFGLGLLAIILILLIVYAIYVILGYHWMFWKY